MKESVDFPYLEGDRQVILKVQLVDCAVLLRPISDAMGLTWDKQRAALTKAFPLTLLKLPSDTARMQLALDINEVQSWLKQVVAGRSKHPERVRHFQDHLVPTLVAKSMNLHARKAKEAKAAQEKKDAVIDVNHPLDGVDHFRRDASRNAVPAMAPDQIASTVKTGLLDLYVKEEPALFDEGEGQFHRVQIVLTPETYRPNLLQDLARANLEVLTGPKMLKQYPNHPLLRRRVLPAQTVVDTSSGKPVQITLPPREEKFPWEY